MKNNIILIAMLIVSTFGFSQFSPVGHLNIFSEDGDRFTLILNGEVINDTPQANLRVEDLNQPYYNVKIKFEDSTLNDISKNNLLITDVDDIFADVTYKIKRDKNNKTKMKMNYFSSVPVRPDFIPPSNIHVIHYGQPKIPVVINQVGGATQTTTTTTTSQSGGANIGVGVNVGGISMGVSINDNTGNGTITQTTTTTTSATQSGNVIVNPVEPIRVGCNGRSSMNATNFNAALATIKKQSFEDTRLKTAKQVVGANCLNVNQIIEIANLFNFEDNKLDFAKHAYDYCIEPRNYFKLNGIFSFSSNVDNLSDYIQSRQ